MSFRKTGIAAGVLATVLTWATAAFALPYNYQMGMQPSASPVMDRIESFHTLLVYVIVAISLFVLLLMAWIVVRYNKRANPVPTKTHHNAVLEVAWTIIPVIILVFIAVPSFKLLYFEAEIPKPDLTIKVIGYQWYWAYEYTGKDGFRFESRMLDDDAAKAAKEPRLLGVDNVVVVPVNKVVEIVTTGADVIHSWALPQMGVKMDAVPGRLNHTWFKATQTGTFYGECSELCGIDHSRMPIEVRVVSDAEYAAWVAATKKKPAIYSPLADAGTTRLAAQ